MTEKEQQQALLEELHQQERELRFDAFGYDDAWELGMLLVRLGRERSHPIAVEITLGEHRVFHVALPGSSADNDDWLERKARVVRKFRHSSLAVRAWFQAAGRDFDRDSRLDPRRFAAHGGCFPLVVGDLLVGVVGVSGLAQVDDHALVVEALREFTAAR